MKATIRRVIAFILATVLVINSQLLVFAENTYNFVIGDTTVTEADAEKQAAYLTKDIFTDFSVATPTSDVKFDDVNNEYTLSSLDVDGLSDAKLTVSKPVHDFDGTVSVNKNDTAVEIDIKPTGAGKFEMPVEFKIDSALTSEQKEALANFKLMASISSDVRGIVPAIYSTGDVAVSSVSFDKTYYKDNTYSSTAGSTLLLSPVVSDDGATITFDMCAEISESAELNEDTVIKLPLQFVLVEPKTVFDVQYMTVGCTITGEEREAINLNSNPTGRTTTPTNASDTFYGWKASIPVKLTDSTTVDTDTFMTDEQIKTIVVTDDIQLTAYYGSEQKATIKFVLVNEYDEVQKVLDTVELTGISDDTISYSDFDIKLREYEELGYTFVETDYVNDALSYDTDSAVDQEFTVKYSIEIQHDTEEKTVTRTVKYVTSDGAAMSTIDKNVVDNVDSVTFSRTVETNPVTGEKTFGNWDPEITTFDSVISPTVEGYTPDIEEVDELKVTPTSENSVVTVTYLTTSKAKATITYLDETTNTTLKIDEVFGNAGELIEYSTTETINNYKKQGYVLSEDGFEPDLFSDTDKEFTVKLKHNIETVTSPKSGQMNEDGTQYPSGLAESDLSFSLTRTVEYKYEDGTKAKDSKVQTVTATRVASVDHVTSEVTYGELSYNPKNVFDRVVTPEMSKYTADKTEIPEKEISTEEMVAGNNITETVTYLRTDGQKATIKYVDKTTGEALKTDTVTGDSNEVIKYDYNSVVKTYTDKGYKLVSISLKDNSKFDNDKEVDQEFLVELEQIVETVTAAKSGQMNTDGTEYPAVLSSEGFERTYTRTIKYVDETDATVAPDKVQTVTYKRTAAVNHVTGEVVFSDWKTDYAVIPAVKSPTIENKFPSVKEVEKLTTTAKDVTEGNVSKEVTVRYGSSEEEVVNLQRAVFKIVYGDTELFKATKTGESGKDINFNFASRIKTYEDKGYKLVSNSYNNDKFDEDFEADQEFVAVVEPIIEEVNGPKSGKMNGDGSLYPSILSEKNLVKNVNRTINYVDNDGKKLKDSYIEVVKFSRGAKVNHVTHEVAFGPWDKESVECKAVIAPVITGYISDKLEIPAKTIIVNDANVVDTVVYSPEAYEVTIKFVDEVGKTLSDEISFVGTYNKTYEKDITDVIKSIEGQHYVLAKNEYPGANTRFTEDCEYTITFKPQTFTVTFVDNGKIVAKQTVNYDGFATAPTMNDKPGYRFMGWDKPFAKIAQDTTVNAVWRNVTSRNSSSRGNGSTTVITGGVSPVNGSTVNSTPSKTTRSGIALANTRKSAITRTASANTSKTTVSSENVDTSKQAATANTGDIESMLAWMFFLSSAALLCTVLKKKLVVRK